jgi:hypothetical protein
MAACAAQAKALENAKVSDGRSWRPCRELYGIAMRGHFLSTDLPRPATVMPMQDAKKISALGTRCFLCLLALAAGCTDGQSDSSNGLHGLFAAEQQREEGESENEGAGGDPVGLEDLDCPRGGETAPIAVTFDCDEITVVSCKDLSNVVLELADGSRQRFEGLHGRQDTFAGSGANQGDRIVGVWVKAGANHSGDGPGYGQRFDAPEGSCTPGDAGPPPGETPPQDAPPIEVPPGENPPLDPPPPSEDPPPPTQGEGPIVVL